jgi:TPR repeat protein
MIRIAIAGVAYDAVVAIVMQVSRLLTGVVIAILLSASSAFAGASADCAAAFYGRQDYAEALPLCQPLAEQGDAKAQYALGFMYELGKGVSQNYVLSHMWFNLAAAHSHADFADYGKLADIMYEAAKSNAEMRDRLANKMTPEQVAEAQRLAREWKPTK